jgi:hypothetical protein
MTIEEAFRLINNLDFPEGLKRKFAPGYSLIHINEFGEIVAVERYKSAPLMAEEIELFKRFPPPRRTVQITAVPGMYSSIDELKERVRDCKEGLVQYLARGLEAFR